MKKKIRIKLNQQALAAMKVIESTPEANTQWFGGLTNAQQDNNHTTSHFNWQPLLHYGLIAVVVGIAFVGGRYSKESKTQPIVRETLPPGVSFDLNTNVVNLEKHDTHVFKPEESIYTSRYQLVNHPNVSYDLQAFAKDNDIKKAVFEDVKARGEEGFLNLKKNQGQLVYKQVVAMTKKEVNDIGDHAQGAFNLYLQSRDGQPIEIHDNALMIRNGLEKRCF